MRLAHASCLGLKWARAIWHYSSCSGRVCISGQITRPHVSRWHRSLPAEGQPGRHRGRLCVLLARASSPGPNGACQVCTLGCWQPCVCQDSTGGLPAEVQGWPGQQTAASACLLARASSLALKGTGARGGCTAPVARQAGQVWVPAAPLAASPAPGRRLACLPLAAPGGCAPLSCAWHQSAFVRPVRCQHLRDHASLACECSRLPANRAARCVFEC